MRALQVSAGVALVALGVVLAVGATGFRADASYSGIGPAFYPGAVAGLLALCGLALVREALTGGYRNFALPPPRLRGALAAAMLVASALLVSAFVITRAGFVPTCGVLFVAAARAFGSRRPVRDLFIGLAVAFALNAIFAKGLGLMLPTITPGGWI